MDFDSKSGIANDFEEFRSYHGKVYESDEEFDYRFAVFMMNAEFIRDHNTKGGSISGYTEFADMTNEEFKGKYLGLKNLK